MWKFIRELACDYLESRQPDAVSKKAPSTAPIVDLNDSSKPSSRMTLDYSRFDRIVADLDQEVCITSTFCDISPTGKAPSKQKEFINPT